MTKKELLSIVENYSDDQELNIVDFEGELIIPDDRSKQAYEVYKEVIHLIAEYGRFDYCSLCDAIDMYSLDYIESYGYVEVEPIVKDGKLFYKIMDSYTAKNDKLYKTLFEDGGGYWVHQICEWEDTYHGEMLLPINGNKWLCVYYHC